MVVLLAFNFIATEPGPKGRRPNRDKNLIEFTCSASIADNLLVHEAGLHTSRTLKACPGQIS